LGWRGNGGKKIIPVYIIVQRTLGGGEEGEKKEWSFKKSFSVS